MLGAGIEPAWEFVPRDFKSLASTGFATRAAECNSARHRTGIDTRSSEQERRYARLWRGVRCCEAGNGTRTRDPNLGKVVLYQLSYSRGNDKATAKNRVNNPRKLSVNIVDKP